MLLETEPWDPEQAKNLRPAPESLRPPGPPPPPVDMSIPLPPNWSEHKGEHRVEVMSYLFFKTDS